MLPFWLKAQLSQAWPLTRVLASLLHDIFTWMLTIWTWSKWRCACVCVANTTPMTSCGQPSCCVLIRWTTSVPLPRRSLTMDMEICGSTKVLVLDHAQLANAIVWQPRSRGDVRARRKSVVPRAAPRG